MTGMRNGISQILLYPLRFEPIYQYRLWGGRRLGNLLTAPLPSGRVGEAWSLSDRDDHPSRVADGPLKGQTVGQLLAQFPQQLLGKLAGRFKEKLKWDPDHTKRKKIKAILDKSIPEFSVRTGGSTSIDITKPGIDKAYGIRKLRDLLGISLKEMIFIGDALYVGGNDYPAEQAGVVSIPVKDPNETKRVTQAIIACLADQYPKGSPWAGD